MEIPGTVTHLLDAISSAGFNPRSPAGELERDRADYRRLLPQQAGPADANGRGGRSAVCGGARCGGAPSGPVNSISEEWNADYMATCLSCQGRERGQAVHMWLNTNTKIQ